jgi:hypothetical protein
MIRQSDSFRTKLDLFVMILAIWNCYSIPFDIAFEPSSLKGTWFVAIDLIIDLTFFFDIIVTFRTTFINKKTGDEVIDYKVIAKDYLKGRFVIDLLPTIPFDYIFEPILTKKISSKLQLF